MRRLDVFKAWFAFTNQVLLCLAAYRLLPDATRYAMGALKHSLHSCYFCYHLNTGAIEDEIAFFTARFGRIKAFADLMEQRRSYHRSFAFILRCAPAILRLHLRTARDNRFPMAVSRNST